MALKALISGKLTRAEDLSEDQFRDLQSQKPQVAMLCCQTRGYMRIREDYQEFVHFRRIHDCLGRPDSPTHDFLKKTVRDAAREAGWDADFEVPDPQPERRWIADVFAHKGKAQVAIEIQTSPITREELAKRQQIYAARGIRSCWFLRHKAVWEFIGPPDKDVPVFDLIVDKGIAEFEVSRYSVAISPRHKMAIKEATISLLSGEFKWRGSRRTKTQVLTGGVRRMYHQVSRNGTIGCLLSRWFATNFARLSAGKFLKLDAIFEAFAYSSFVRLY